ncbi:hypothetical protein ACWENQ_16275 [Nonomuraea sp. NPDC004354]
MNRIRPMENSQPAIGIDHSLFVPNSPSAVPAANQPYLRQPVARYVFTMRASLSDRTDAAIADDSPLSL